MDLNLSVDASGTSDNSYSLTSNSRPLNFTFPFLHSYLTTYTSSPSASIFFLLVVSELSSSSVSMASEKVILPIPSDFLAMGVTIYVYFITANVFLCETSAFFIGEV